MINLPNILQLENWTRFGVNPFTDKIKMVFSDRVSRMQCFDNNPFILENKTL